MDGTKAFNPPDIGDDEHIIRRLGWAVVRQWDSLPKDTRDRIQRQAVFIGDRYATVQLDQQISVFVRKHSGAKDA